MNKSNQKIVTVCTLCNAHLRIDVNFVERRIRCPKCNGVFEVKALKFGEESDALASRDALETTADVTPSRAKSSRSEEQQQQPETSIEKSETVEFESESNKRAADEKQSPESSDEVYSSNGKENKELSLSRESSGSIGRYNIDRELGKGAFGVVYSARDPVLERQVAIKVQTRTLDESSFDKMLLEARAAAKLRHPNIVAVFEVDVDQGKPFVVSELIDGKSLADRIQLGPIDPQQAATWIRDVARGLAYAHREGLIHRDVKPQNILIDSCDRPQLADFGLAVDRNDEQQRESAAYSRSGTLAYMAPEQAGVVAASVAPAVDQYALGATLFEMLSGQRPHPGGSHEIIAGLEKAEPPRVRSVRSDVPYDLDSICFKAMAHEPWNRYEDCDELADDLDRFLNGELIRGRKIGLVERARHYAKKHPRIAAWTTGGVVSATGLFLAATTSVIQRVYIVQKQIEKLQGQVVQANNDLRQAVGIQGAESDKGADVEDVLASTGSLSSWVSYSRKLNKAVRSDLLGDKELSSKLLDESQEAHRGWEYRHLNARRQQGLVSTFTIDQPNVIRMHFGPDNLSVIVQSQTSPVVKHYSIRDGALLTEWNAEPDAPMAVASHKPVAYYVQPNTNLIKSWDWSEKKEGPSIQLPFPTNYLLLSNDDKWLYASLPNWQFAVVNLESNKVLFDPNLKQTGSPKFANDSSSLAAVLNGQLHFVTFSQQLQSQPAMVPADLQSWLEILGSFFVDGKYSIFSTKYSNSESLWLIHKDGRQISSIKSRPIAIRLQDPNGPLTVYSLDKPILQIIAVGTGFKPSEVKELHLPKYTWLVPTVSPDGRLIVGVEKQTLFIWDLALISPQYDSDDLVSIQAAANDGESTQTIVLGNGNVSSVDVETGKVMWSRQDDQ